MTVAETGPAPSASARAFLAEAKRMLIAGQWRDAQSGRTSPIIDPSSGREVGRFAAAGRADVDLAAQAARAAFEDGRWSRLRADSKSALLWRLADLIDTHAAELAELESIDVGKPISLSLPEIAFSAQTLRYYAGWPSKIYGTVNPVDPTHFGYTVREPVGVVAAIMPWNGPLGMAAKALGPALACGNTIILKPAEQTVLTTIRLAELVQEAGFPDSVVQVITGLGDPVGAALVEHPEVDKIAFTGSTQVGKQIMAAAAPRLKKVSLELGGKGPHLVFPDVDLAEVVSLAFSPFHVWFNTGQICGMGSRWIVHESIKDDFLTAAVQASSSITIGPALDPTSQMGPLVSAEQLGRVSSYLERGCAEGAEVVLGGRRIDRDGYFVEPTIFDHVGPSMTIAREEIFGPVVGVFTVADEDEAIAIANSTDYGLTSGVWTNDLKRAHRVAGRIKSGVVWINGYGDYDLSVPFGGYKLSGIGREHGQGAIDAYTQLKSVYSRLETPSWS